MLRLKLARRIGVKMAEVCGTLSTGTLPERYLVRHLLGGTGRTGGCGDTRRKGRERSQSEYYLQGCKIEQITGVNLCIFLEFFVWK
ncbi:hypothetical protein Zmor_025754 [Zophobas morio]|uniref:Uncharacterized protein n=1 Tax=Zophobas morio TaxID=2755281 RepID=A0AA38M4E6_9CUCU|nr:hypothetical protein Zmor_025754 [Zophobas morio]